MTSAIPPADQGSNAAEKAYISGYDDGSQDERGEVGAELQQLYQDTAEFQAQAKHWFDQYEAMSSERNQANEMPDYWCQLTVERGGRIQELEAALEAVAMRRNRPDTPLCWCMADEGHTPSCLTAQKAMLPLADYDTGEWKTMIDAAEAEYGVQP